MKTILYRTIGFWLINFDWKICCFFLLLLPSIHSTVFYDLWINIEDSDVNVCYNWIVMVNYAPEFVQYDFIILRKVKRLVLKLVNESVFTNTRNYFVYIPKGKCYRKNLWCDKTHIINPSFCIQGRNNKIQHFQCK